MSNHKCKATKIIIEDQVMPQLLTSALEAYEIMHRAHKKGKEHNRLETFGLLWGYALPTRNDHPSRIAVNLATVETSALRHQNWVSPSTESIQMKVDFMKEFWPHIELIGTFHSHPYENISEVNQAKGWRASTSIDNETGDEGFWPYFHESNFPELDEMAHLVITVAAMGRASNSPPQRLSGKEKSSGHTFNIKNHKVWIKGYTTAAFEEIDMDEASSEITETRTYGVFGNEDVSLEIPSLAQRFSYA